MWQIVFMASLQDATNKDMFLQLYNQLQQVILPASTRFHFLIMDEWKVPKPMGMYCPYELFSWVDGRIHNGERDISVPMVFSQKALCRVHLHLAAHFLMCCINMLLLLFIHRPYLIQRIGDLGKDWQWLFSFGGSDCTLPKIYKKGKIKNKKNKQSRTKLRLKWLSLFIKLKK